MIRKKFNPFPKLETDRLLLVKISDAYQHDLFEIYSDPEVAKYDYFMPFTKKEQVGKLIEKINKEIKSEVEITWGIVLKENGKMIGTCCFGNFNNKARRTEIGYTIGKNSWGQGYATEATSEIIRYGFREMNLNRIEATITPDNSASVRVLEKLGFKTEGIVRQRDYIKNQLVDGVIMSQLKEEYALKNTIDIDTVSDDEMPHFWKMFNKYINELAVNASLGDEIDLEYFYSEEYRGEIEKIRKRSQNPINIYFVKEQDKIIGFIINALFLNGIGESIVMECYIKPDYRGFGYGKRAFCKLEDAVRKLGVERMILTPTNIKNENFWRRLGFEKTGEVDEDNKSIYRKVLT